MCANASIDRTYEVENFATGQYHMPRRFIVVPGGKGVNVARNLAVLGEEVFLTGFAGRLSKVFIGEKLGLENIASDFVPIGEESRVCINIIDRTARSQTQVDEIGPLVTPDEVDRLKRLWRRLLQHCRIAIISGSAPRGVPFHLYENLVIAATKQGVPVILDARDQLLQHAMNAQPQVIKPNLAELETVMGKSLSVPADVVAVSRQHTGPLHPK